MKRLLLDTALFTLIAPAALTTNVPALIVWLTSAAPATGVLLVLGAGAIGAGVATYAWCAQEFIRTGRGTPAPYNPPRELVVHGLYRLVRNPMYCGVSAVMFGEAALFGSDALLVYAVIVLLGFHVRVVSYEEPTLSRAFGISWERYKGQVPRWLPRLPRP